MVMESPLDLFFAGFTAIIGVLLYFGLVNYIPQAIISVITIVLILSAIEDGVQSLDNPIIVPFSILSIIVAGLLYFGWYAYLPILVMNVLAISMFISAFFDLLV